MMTSVVVGISRDLPPAMKCSVGGGGGVAERAVRPLGIVVLAEVSDKDGRFGDGLELLAVEERIAEAFDNQFPRTGRGDIDRLKFLLH